ncbi:hypothetical protein L227DRAFT_599590 [Lentinus tigrinus ALCF2SS1-6]|uniref:F-box domain-containing protein n=1 Tax=Lentinus tigrinus ALCF2SS1-6 TaxID=1328759 RepID=A0A5C2SGR2_9APHY|nr:hypothetical protein L227DRAFT_599590 [Lentinus tigrinus ALCF2SS1-6]
MATHDTHSSVGAAENGSGSPNRFRTSALQATALRDIENFQNKIKHYEGEIRALREHYIPKAKFAYNSGSPINQLPIELLMLIFRAVGPRSSPADVFWLDFLDSDDKIFALNSADYSIVLHALERSAPATNVSFSLMGAFLPSMETFPNHLSRITSLWLDCSGSRNRNVRPFFNLQMPQLEELTLWMCCRYMANRPVDTEAQASARFPKLRYLQTNCTKYSLGWISPTTRYIWLGASRDDVDAKSEPAKCCRLRSLHQLMEVLFKCPNLTHLSLDSCLPPSATSGQLPLLALPDLAYLHLRDKTDVVRSIVEHLVLPESTEVSLASKSKAPYQALSELLPTVYPISVLSPIHHLAVEVGDISHEQCARYSVRGGTSDDADEDRLSLHSVNMQFEVVGDGTNGKFDMFRFFQGFTSIFPPSSITTLKLSCYDPFRDNGGFTYILRYYPHLTHLNLVLTSLESVFEALAQDGVVPHLQKLEVEAIIRGSQYSSAHDVIVSALEARASGGRCIQSFSFSERAFRFNPQADLPPPMAAHLIRRLASIIPHISIYVIRNGSKTSVKPE